MLAGEGVTVEPLFGVPEERIRSMAEALPGAGDTDMGAFYHVSAPDADLEALADRLALADRRIDRVDVFDDGRLAIVDYKTGMARPLDWLGDRAEPVQLRSTAWAADRKGIQREEERLPCASRTGGP